MTTDNDQYSSEYLAQAAKAGLPVNENTRVVLTTKGKMNLAEVNFNQKLDYVEEVVHVLPKKGLWWRFVRWLLADKQEVRYKQVRPAFTSVVIDLHEYDIGDRKVTLGYNQKFNVLAVKREGWRWTERYTKE